MRKRKRRNHLLLFAILVLVITALSTFSYLKAGPENDRHTVVVSSRFDPSFCERIEVALVCAGQPSTLSIVTLLKSILFYRHNPIRFHFIVDEISFKILSNLFSTWALPFVETRFYNSSLMSSRITWIPNQHYSSIYGLMKITLPEFFPPNIDKLLVLDTDVLLVSDIAELWSFWHHMDQKQAFGLIENLSDWYVTRNNTGHVPWPALGRGFNTGVILMSLQKLRSIGWQDLWVETTERNLKELNFTQLADQDIINAVISEHPELVFKLPCEWNFQMGFESRQHLCPVCISELKVVHWNSPRKTSLQSRHAAFFNRYYKMFSDMDGNLFRSQTLPCYITPEHQDLRFVYEYDDDDDGCSEIRHARTVVYRSQLFVRPYSYQAEANDVSLVSQFSMDRFVLFEALLQHWTGPVSAAVYCTDLELSQLLQHMSSSNTFANRTNIALHAVFKEGIHYPVNYLRNVALNTTDVPYVFLVDVDFLPMPGLYARLRSVLLEPNITLRSALVVPAFEFKFVETSLLPESKAKLLGMLDSGQVQIFRQDVWIQGHSATDYDKWRTATLPYYVKWQTDYEPYIVTDRRQTPPYDQRFVGFGWNKVSHIMLLDSMGFTFTVLPDVYIVHRPHSPSFEIVKYRSSSAYRKCLKALKGEFVRDLVRSKHSLRRN